jgi:hypothetical protein
MNTCTDRGIFHVEMRRTGDLLVEPCCGRSGMPGDVDHGAPAGPGSRDLRLVAGAPEIDAGDELSNLNDGFELDGAPDLGAFEVGQPLPSYGPRPWVLFADGFEEGDSSRWSAIVP